MKPRKLAVVLLSLSAVLWMAAPAGATLLYSDIFLWYDNGDIQQIDFMTGQATMHPGPQPLAGVNVLVPEDPKLILKVEEDVITYDPVIHPNVNPGMDRYVYTISNVGYDSGNIYAAGKQLPGVGVNGLSGVDIYNVYGVPMGPTGTPIDPVSGTPWLNAGWSWDMPATQGHGIGSPHPLSPLALSGFWFEVPRGTPHGLVPMSVNSHDPNNGTVNLLPGLVSGPTPEPGTLALGALGVLGILAARKRR